MTSAISEPANGTRADVTWTSVSAMLSWNLPMLSADTKTRSLFAEKASACGELPPATDVVTAAGSHLASLHNSTAAVTAADGGAPAVANGPRKGLARSAVGSDRSLMVAESSLVLDLQDRHIGAGGWNMQKNGRALERDREGRITAAEVHELGERFVGRLFRGEGDRELRAGARHHHRKTSPNIRDRATD